MASWSKVETPMSTPSSSAYFEDLWFSEIALNFMKWVNSLITDVTYVDRSFVGTIINPRIRLA